MTNAIVTLFEMYGSGAEEIGRRVADRLGVPWVPQAFSSDEIENAQEARRQEPDDSLIARMFRVLGNTPSVLDDRGGQALFAKADYDLVQDNTRHVLESTRNGGVLLGRNGAVILADRPEAVHVLLTGNVEDRVARAARSAGIDQERARRRQESEDELRAEMSQRLYHWDPRDPARYDLVINTSRIDPEAVADIIVDASRAKTG